MYPIYYKPEHPSTCSPKDRYKRIVDRVYVGNLDVNAKLVKQGYAWVYRRYAKDQELYRLEKEAQEGSMGQ